MNNRVYFSGDTHFGRDDNFCVQNQQNFFHLGDFGANYEALKMSGAYLNMSFGNHDPFRPDLLGIIMPSGFSQIGIGYVPWGSGFGMIDDNYMKTISNPPGEVFATSIEKRAFFNQLNAYPIVDRFYNSLKARVQRAQNLGYRYYVLATHAPLFGVENPNTSGPLRHFFFNSIYKQAVESVKTLFPEMEFYIVSGHIHASNFTSVEGSGITQITVGKSKVLPVVLGKETPVFGQDLPLTDFPEEFSF